MKVEKTYLELILFNNQAKAYVSAHKDADNKLSSSLKSVMSKQIEKHFEDYNDEVDTLQLNNCAVDEKTKVILKNEQGGRQYTVEGEKKLKKESKELLAQKVTIHARISDGIDELIAELTDEEKKHFSGIVIPEQIDLDQPKDE